MTTEPASATETGTSTEATDGGSPAREHTGSRPVPSSDESAAEPSPADTQPAEPSPADTQPAEPSPADTQPAKPSPADTQPAEPSPVDTQPAEPADPWAAFGPAPEVPPSRRQRVASAIGGVLVHEWTLAALASVGLAVVMTWPTLRYPLYTIPQDTWDPTLQAWQIAWSGHILLTDPSQLWHSNTFFPERWSFAFSDTLLGYAPAGMIGEGQAAALLRYNILFVLAHALAALGAYALARQLGARRAGAAVAAAAFAYAPWLLAQAGHLHVLSNGGIPLALAMLARGHGWSLRHGRRPERANVTWTVAGWLVATWQISLGFGIGLPFAYVLGGIVVVVAGTLLTRRLIRRTPGVPFGPALLLANLAGGLVFVAVGALLAIPYFTVAANHPYAERTVADVQAYSPPLAGFFVAPAESWLWGSLHESARAGLAWAPEMTLLPGFVLYGLAVAGLLMSIWTIRQRVWLLVAALVTGSLAMGSEFFGGHLTYLAMFEHLPGWSGLRTPGRLTLWLTLLLALLAAGAVSAFEERVRDYAANRIPPWPGPWLRLLTVLPLALVLVEGIGTTPHPIVPRAPVAMGELTGPVLVLPSDQGVDQQVMLWSTDGFPDVVNGGSGFTPQRLDEVREATRSFPNLASVQFLRGLGVQTVVVLTDQVSGTPWENAPVLPVESLDIERTDVGDAVVFRL